MKRFNIYTGSESIEAEGFRIIARYVHDVYDGASANDMAGDEVFIVGIVHAVEHLLAALAEEKGE